MQAANRSLICGLLFLAAASYAFADIRADAEQARVADHAEEAIELYRQAVARDPAWTEGWWYLGTLLYDRDDFAGAADALRRAADLDAKSGQTIAMLGLSEAETGKNQDALKHLRQALKLGLADQQLRDVVLYRTGMLWLDLAEARGGFDQAQQEFDLLAAERVHTPELITAMGLAVLRMRAAGANPELVEEAGEAEYLAAQGGHASEALSAYQRLEEKYPQSPGVEFAYGKYLVTRGDDDLAVAAFRREIVNSPNHLLARLGIAGLRVRSKTAEALPYAEEAVKLAPELPEAHYLLGFALLKLDRVTGAIRELEVAQREAPNLPKIYFALSHAYTKADRLADAARARSEFKRLDNQSQ